MEDFYSNSMEERYIACFILGAIGDTIGFGNGDWEFNDYDLETINMVLVRKHNHGHKFNDEVKNYFRMDQFIALGGYSGINLDGWYVSDDTVLMISLAQSFIEIPNKTTDVILSMLRNMYFANRDMKLAGKEKVDRLFGSTTEISLKKIYKKYNGEQISPSDLEFNEKGGGSGASMRSMCLGLVYHDKKDLDKLLYVSIVSSMLTHSHPTGYLGGMVSALFTSYAIQGVGIEKWCDKLLKLFKTNKITKVMKKIGKENIHNENSGDFVQAWKDYNVFRFENNKPVFAEEWKYTIDRYSTFLEVFTNKYNTTDWVGSSGIDSLLFAYDCLLYCEGSFERLLYYSTLHMGDSDTTGIIACSWFGAVHGFKGISENLYEHLEFKDVLVFCGQKLNNNYYSKKKNTTLAKRTKKIK